MITLDVSRPCRTHYTISSVKEAHNKNKLSDGNSRVSNAAGTQHLHPAQNKPTFFFILLFPFTHNTQQQAREDMSKLTQQSEPPIDENVNYKKKMKIEPLCVGSSPLDDSIRWLDLIPRKLKRLQHNHKSQKINDQLCVLRLTLPLFPNGSRVTEEVERWWSEIRRRWWRFHGSGATPNA